MNAAAEIPVWATVLTSALLVGGALLTLIGSLGLVKLDNFYQRVHAPTLGTTLGITFIALSSMIYFTAQGTRPVIHEVLLIVFLTVTTPISLMILVRAALLRDESENNAPPTERHE